MSRKLRLPWRGATRMADASQQESALRNARLFWVVIGLAYAPSAQAQTADATLLGNIGGIRTMLGNAGITLALSDTENLLGNLAGGVKQGATLQGVTTGTLEIDTGKAFGIAGGTFHVSTLQIHGQNLSPAYLDNLQTANGDEAADGTRLWELWYDQALNFAAADIKIGQQSIDNEFLISKNSTLFINTGAGWPLLASADLYGGGPAYPLATLGGRVQAKLSNNGTVLAGVFDDNPGGGAFTADAQKLDAAGTKFNLNTGALFIAELQYAANQPPAGQGAPAGLAGTYKIGFWYDTGFFPDQRYANPHKGDYALYGIIDQTVWQSGQDAARNVNLFARLEAAPAAQNLINLNFNGGVTMASPLPGRDNDQAGFDIGIGHVSHRAAGLDRDEGQPPRGTETLLDLTYQAQVTGWLQLQPDIQYILHPGGGLTNPANPSTLLKNELVAGVRAITAF